MNRNLSRNLLILLILALVAFFALKNLTGDGGTKATVAALQNLDTATQISPLVAQNVKNPNLEQAYKIQKLLVGKSNKEVYGFKAALTAKGAQKKFGLSSPLTGVLFKDGALTTGAKIKARDFIDLKIETELAFFVSKDINSKITSANLADHIGFVAAAIELPSLKFDNMQKMQAFDLAAANSGSNKFIVGEKLPFTSVDINSIQVDMFVDGEKSYQGSATEVMQDQTKALVWIINSLIEQGWKLEKDALILTGALGKVLPAKVGNYQAKWSKFAPIEFEIE